MHIQYYGLAKESLQASVSKKIFFKFQRER